MLHDPHTVYVGVIGVWLLCVVVIYVAIRSVWEASSAVSRRQKDHPWPVVCVCCVRAAAVPVPARGSFIRGEAQAALLPIALNLISTFLRYMTLSS